LVVFCYWLGAYTCAFDAARRMKASPLACAAWAVLMVVGCNLFEVCLYGDVWNMAQGLNLFLSLACVDLLVSSRPWQWGLGLFCLALSVGCRPFQAFYVPFALWFTGRKVWRDTPRLRVFLVRMAALTAAPAAFALLLCLYNYIRFDHIFEFGHNYLNEFANEAEHGQFSFAYFGNNFTNIWRLPYLEGGWLKFPSASGFAFYLANPLFLLLGLRIVGAARKKDWSVGDGILVLSLGLHFVAFLLHKSFGGWQFGTRYLCDLLPYAFVYCLLHEPRIGKWEVPIFVWAVAFNLYGAWAFHTIL